MFEFLSFLVKFEQNEVNNFTKKITSSKNEWISTKNDKILIFCTNSKTLEKIWNFEGIGAKFG